MKGVCRGSGFARDIEEDEAIIVCVWEGERERVGVKGLTCRVGGREQGRD